MARVNPRDNPNLKAKVEQLLATEGVMAVIESLTAKQKKFAEEYVREFSATDAIFAAGFDVANRGNAKRMGDNLADHPAVRVYIRYLTEKRAERAVVSVDYVLRKIVKTIDAMDEDIKNPKAAGVLLRATELLAKHLGMFTEKVELTGADGGPIQTEEIRESADAFTRSIARIAERNREGEGASPTTH